MVRRDAPTERVAALFLHGTKKGVTIPGHTLIHFLVKGSLSEDAAKQAAGIGAGIAAGVVLLTEFGENARYSRCNVAGNRGVQVKFGGQLRYQVARYGGGNVREGTVAGKQVGEAAKTAACQAGLKAAYNVAGHFLVYISRLVCRQGSGYLGMVFQLLFYQ